MWLGAVVQGQGCVSWPWHCPVIPAGNLPLSARGRGTEGTEAEQLSSPQLGGEEQNLAEAEVPGEPGTKSIPQVP